MANESRDSSETPLSSKDGTFIFGKDISTQPIVAANSRISGINASFLFKGRQLSIGAGHGSWFYCKITYKDVFGIERHTSYYVGLYGAAARYPTNKKIDEQYNAWD